MWKLLPLLFILTSCSAKIVYVNIENRAGGDVAQELTSEGATFTTDTDQAADGKLEVPVL